MVEEGVRERKINERELLSRRRHMAKKKKRRRRGREETRGVFVVFAALLVECIMSMQSNV